MKSKPKPVHASTCKNARVNYCPDAPAEPVCSSCGCDMSAVRAANARLSKMSNYAAARMQERMAERDSENAVTGFEV